MDSVTRNINGRLTIATVSSLSAILIIWTWARTRSGNKLPPGPSLEPIIGGLRTMPSHHQWVTFAEWSKKWGDVVYTSLFGAPVIVINSIDVARDLLDKRGANFSDRPRAVVYNELIGWDSVVSMAYGDRFRKHRRLMSQVLNSQAVVVYRDLQTNNVKTLLKGFLDQPENFDLHIFRQAYTTLIRVTYGLDVVSDNDTLVLLFEETLNRIVDEGAPGACMIDLFPLVKYIPSWFPGGGFQKRLKITRGYTQNMKDAPLARVQEERRRGTASLSLVGKLLEDYDTMSSADPDHVYDIKLVGAAMYAAGVETTATTMATFIQMMAKHTEIVSRAQKEIDDILHQERLPTLDDRASLPIIDCIMKEVFRIHAPVPLCVPHASVDEDVYRDLRIPAGSTIIPNIWQMLRDPKHFPAPDIFNPERFREKAVGLKGNSIQALNGLDRDDPSAIVFGFGRRICPGRYFVDASLWLLMSNILAVFDIGPPLGPDGKPEVIGDIEYTSGITSRPVSFNCTITPRNAKCASLIRDAEIETGL